MQESPHDKQTQMPETPQSAKQEIANTPRELPPKKRYNRLLTPEAKAKTLVKMITQLPPAELLEAAISAALAGYQFPDIIADNLGSLQLAYQKNYDKDYVRAPLELAIRNYMQHEGIIHINKLLQQAIVADQWQSALVKYLAESLKTTIETHYLVEGVVIKGKIYWRIVDDNHNVLQVKTKTQEQVFDNDQTWLMSWQQFLAFKASGKRHSNVKISRELFVSKFSPQAQAMHQAGLIWAELCQKNIITPKLKLSDSWRLQSGSHLQIDAVRLGKITHNDIANVLHAITFDQKWQEPIPVNNLNFIKPLRQERSPKSWTGDDGWIVNANPTEPNYCNKLWDVTLYLEMLSHRNTAEELRLYTRKLNYDHSPSVAEDKSVAKEHIKAFLEAVSCNQIILSNLAFQLTTLSTSQLSGVTTRSALQHHLNTDPKAVELQRQINAAQQAISENESAINLFQAECQITHGGFWWAIAIPEKLHFQGETFLKEFTPNEGEPPLLRDVKCYLDILEKRPEDFNLTRADVLLAMGAFRFLYHKETILPLPIPGAPKHVGYAPYALVNSPASYTALDTFFNQRIKKYIQKQEGLDTELKLLPKKINF